MRRGGEHVAISGPDFALAGIECRGQMNCICSAYEEIAWRGKHENGRSAEKRFGHRGQNPITVGYVFGEPPRHIARDSRGQYVFPNMPMKYGMEFRQSPPGRPNGVRPTD